MLENKPGVPRFAHAHCRAKNFPQGRGKKRENSVCL